MAKDMGYTNIVTFVDDGVSGVTMDRPGFNEMMRQLEEGRVTTISSISTVPITTVAGAAAHLPTISVWIFWNRWFWGRLSGLQNMPCVTRTNFSRLLWAAPKRR